MDLKGAILRVLDAKGRSRSPEALADISASLLDGLLGHLGAVGAWVEAEEGKGADTTVYVVKAYYLSRPPRKEYGVVARAWQRDGRVGFETTPALDELLKRVG